MRKLLIIAILFLSARLFAEERMVLISHEVAIAVPDHCKDSFDVKRQMLVISDKGFTCLIKTFPFNGDDGTLDSEWTKTRKLDTLYFEDLRFTKLVKKEKNKFYELGKDYVKKTYFDKNVYDVTYVTRTIYGMYLLRFTTDNKSELFKFDEMINSIIHERGNLLKRTQLAFATSPYLFGAIAVLTVLCAMFVYHKGEFKKNFIKACLLFTIIAAFMSWGFGWDVELLTGPLIITFILVFGSCVFGYYITAEP